MSAHVGRDTLVQYCIANETADVGSLTFIDLGMTRGRSLEDTWDTVDVTGDKSPQFTRQKLVSFKEVKASIDGVSYDDAVHNQIALKAHVAAPGAATSGQPKVWLRFVNPAYTRTGPFIVTSLKDDEPYDDAATWSMEFESNGSCSFVPA